MVSDEIGGDSVCVHLSSIDTKEERLATGRPALSSLACCAEDRLLRVELRRRVGRLV